MQIWCFTKRISLTLAIALGVPAVSFAQQPAPLAAYAQVQSQPFQRTLLTQSAQVLPTAPFVDLAELMEPTASASLILPYANPTVIKATAFTEGNDETLDELIEFQPTPTNDAINSVKSAHVVVQPPLVQPYKKNQFSFVIENLGQLDAEDLKIELTVEDDAKIIAMLPSEAVVTDQTALLNIKRLRAAEHLNLHLTATSDSGSPIKFTARLIHSSKQTFDAATHPAKIAVSPLTQHVQTTAKSFPVATLPVTNRNSAIPVVTTEPDFQPRPHFQTNPHFQGLPSAAPLLNNPIKPRTPFKSVSSGQLTTTIGPVAQRPGSTFTKQDSVPRPAEANQFQPRHELNEFNFSDDMSNPPTDETSLLAQPASSMTTDAPGVELLEGPRNMVQDSTREFTLNIPNTTDADVQNVLVQLRIPQGLQIVKIDRDTWYDDEGRTLSFRIPFIATGTTVSVPYQLKANQSGFQIQKLSFEAEGLPRTDLPFDTFVRE